MVSIDIAGPFTTADGLDRLRPFDLGMHASHLAVSAYGPLVRDPEESWRRRRLLYEAAVRDEHAVYFLARRGDGQSVGYALAVPTPGPDDTFDTDGVLELVSLSVADGHRGAGIGRRLVAAVEDHARTSGIQTVKIGVLVGNDRAEGLYRALGYRPAETLLYRRVEIPSPLLDRPAAAPVSGTRGRRSE